MSGAVPWTPDEDRDLLEALKVATSEREMVERIGRSIDAIRSRALRLGHRSMGTLLLQNARAARKKAGGPESETRVSLPRDRPSVPLPPERDLLEVAEERDSSSRLRRQVDDLVLRLREANARQAFIEEAGRYRAPPALYKREKKSGLREMVPVVLASDWHVEEPVYPESIAGRNEYNLKIAKRRVERFFRSIIWNVEHQRASGRIAIRDLVLWLGGDLYSGFIHEELMEENLLSPTEAIRWLLPLLRDGIATLLEVLDLAHLEVPCSHGNHGRTTKKPRVSTGYANSFDWLLYHSLADEFRKDKRVHFEITASAHQYVDVFGQTLHFHHGDEVNYQGGIGGLGIPLLKAVPMWDRIRACAIHCIGHWHQIRDYGRAVVNGSLIGFNPYAQRIRAEYEDPQQLLFYWDSKRGKAMPTALWVSESPDAATSPAGLIGGARKVET